MLTSKGAANQGSVSPETCHGDPVSIEVPQGSMEQLPTVVKVSGLEFQVGWEEVLQKALEGSEPMRHLPGPSAPQHTPGPVSSQVEKIVNLQVPPQGEQALAGFENFYIGDPPSHSMSSASASPYPQLNHPLAVGLTPESRVLTGGLILRSLGDRIPGPIESDLAHVPEQQLQEMILSGQSLPGLGMNADTTVNLGYLKAGATVLRDDESRRPISITYPEGQWWNCQPSRLVLSKLQGLHQQFQWQGDQMPGGIDASTLYHYNIMKVWTAVSMDGG